MTIGTWWRSGVIYQIYPRSFKDSNNDGIGDLRGVIEKLDYIVKTLQLPTIWLSPIYPSPMHDFGYDVADYCDINPMFGTLADFDELLTKLHQRGMKLILDLVPNHTSSDHVWFLESRSSKLNPKRDWYIWRDPKPDGSPPNNWLSHFGGPAWTYDHQTSQYYLHQFVSQQPELNYRQPAVLEAMKNVMRFWLDRGVDGFRVDVIGLMMKDPEFRDEPLNPDWDGVDKFGSIHHIHTSDLPEVHDLIHEFRKVLDEYDDRMMVGETYYDNQRLAKYFGTPEKLECHLPFNFQLIMAEWDAAKVHKMVDDYEASLPDFGWPNWVLGNHDQHRVATRVGIEQARVAYMMLLTMRGTPTVYYGDEIGMTDGLIPPHKIQDPPALNQPDIAHIVGRDPERTPMQWDVTENAGFSGAIETWLPVSENYLTVNVATESEDPSSFLSFFSELSKVRAENTVLRVGSYRSLDLGAQNHHVFAFLREYADQKVLIALNFTDQPQFIITGINAAGKILVSTIAYPNTAISTEKISLPPNIGLVIKLD